MREHPPAGSPRGWHRYMCIFVGKLQGFVLGQQKDPSGASESCGPPGGWTRWPHNESGRWCWGCASEVCSRRQLKVVSAKAMAELFEQGSGTAFSQCENHSVAPELRGGGGGGEGGGLALRVRGMMMMMEADILWGLKLRANG